MELTEMTEKDRINDPDRCPADPEAVSERYLTASLSREEAVAFEAHFLSCPRCSERLQFTEQFVVAVRRATARLRPPASA
jgi:hypothetical protein